MRTKIFISYARRDGKTLANRLRDDLIAAGHEVWLDTSEIEGGASWSREIEKAIDDCVVALLLLSKAAYESEVCRGEHLRALRKKKQTIPLLVQADSDRPVYLEHLNYHDFSDDVRYADTLHALITEMTTGEVVPLPERFRTTPAQAPSLPRHFIPRPEEMQALRDAVLNDNTDRQIALTALQGLGGIGKSVLAAALCHEEAVQNAYPDGIIWVPVGREPGNLVEQMRLVGTKLGDALGHYTSDIAAADRLRELLPQKSALIVLDDVWNAAHLVPFVIDAPRCRVLFTTRDEGVARHPKVQANIVSLGTLKPDQAQALLYKLTGHDDPAFPEIADRLGCLTLALELVGSQLSVTGMSGAAWLEALRSISQITVGGELYPDDPHDSLERCFDLSVQTLRQDNDRLLYYTFGIFPEEVWVPQPVVVRLWQHLRPDLDTLRCEMLITKLAQLALIDRNAENHTITLHDLLHDYTRERLGKQYVPTHTDLLAAYNPDRQPWPQIPHDGYLYHHLAYHLREAGRCTELYDLLTASPAWMEAKFVACVGDTSYVADLDQAIADFDDPLNADQVLILTQLYTARQVVHARVSIYTDDDLKTLAWLGREQEALSHARLRGEPTEQFDGLMAIYEAQKQQNRADHALLDDLLPLARSIREKERRATALSNLAAALAQAGSEQAADVFRDAGEVARSFQSEEWRAYALSELAAALAQAGRYTEASEVARSLQSEWKRSAALSNLAAALAQAGSEQAADVFREAGEVAHGLQDEGMRASALSALAAALAQAGSEQAADVFLEAGEVARGLQDEGRRAYALSALAVALAQAGRYAEAGEVARGLQDEGMRASALSALAAALAQAGRYTEAGEVARGLQNEGWRASALSALAAALAQAGNEQAADVFREAGEVARGFQGEYERVYALSALAAALAQAGHYAEAGEVARGIQDEWWRAEALCALVSALAQAGNEQVVDVFREAGEVARGLQDEDDRAYALRALAAALAQAGNEQAADVFRKAGEVARGLQDEGRRAYALSALAAALAQAGNEQTADVFREAGEMAHGIQDEYERACALSDLAVALAQAGNEQTADVFREAGEVTRGIQHEGRRKEALRDLAAALAQAGHYAEAGEVARGIQDEYERAFALSDLAVALAQTGHYAEAGEVARGIQAEYERAEALRALATALAQAGRTAEAFFTLRKRDPNEFVQTVAAWNKSFEAIRPGLSFHVLREMLRIIGWVRPDWRTIHELLTAGETN